MTEPNDDLYVELSKLLEDVFKFLQNQDTVTRLLPNERILADSLINRCKTQLQEISKITDYVVMNSQSDLPNSSQNKLEDEEQVYNFIEEVPQNICPYLDLPASKIGKTVKCGYLSWKVKVLLNFSKMKRVFAILHNNWMLIYNGEKDLRPIECIDLKYFEACEVSNSQNNKNFLFEVKSTKDEFKFLFSSVAYKDMIQWTTHINKIHDSLVIKSKPRSSITDPDPHSDIDDLSIISDQDLYVDVDETIVPKKPVIPPELPFRPGGNDSKPLPPVPPSAIQNEVNQDENEEEEELYDVPIIVTKESLPSPSPPPPPAPAPPFEEDDSFSEDDEEDNIYDVFVSDQRPPAKPAFTSFKPPTSPNIPNKPALSEKPVFTRIQSRKWKS